MSEDTQNKPLILIGYWRSRQEPFWPDPARFVDPDWPASKRTAILDYLNSFEPSGFFFGFSWCRFRCEQQHVGSAEFNDGFWRWPEGLAHYVREHQVRLPDEFVDYALDRRIPEIADEFWWQEQKGWRTGSSFATPA